MSVTNPHMPLNSPSICHFAKYSVFRIRMCWMLFGQPSTKHLVERITENTITEYYRILNITECWNFGPTECIGLIKHLIRCPELFGRPNTQYTEYRIFRLFDIPDYSNKAVHNTHTLHRIPEWEYLQIYSTSLPLNTNFECRWSGSVTTLLTLTVNPWSGLMVVSTQESGYPLTPWCTSLTLSSLRWRLVSDLRYLNITLPP